MKKPSKLKKHKNLVIGCSIGAVMLSAVAGLLVLNYTPPDCSSLVNSFQSQNLNRIVVKHSDGGLVVSNSTEEGKNSFLAYLGPNSVSDLVKHLIESGYVDVKVVKEGTCKADNGLVYATVQGEFTGFSVLSTEHK